MDGGRPGRSSSPASVYRVTVYLHKNGCTTDQIRGIADYAVVGRPIYLAADPVEAAAAYRRALA